MPSRSESEAAQCYTDGPVRIVPGFRDMQRMCALLLREHVGETGNVLVLGAGGGLELKRFAELQPGWMFVGVDPSGPMLDLAVKVLGPLATRVELHHGYIQHAPRGPFDGATCLLVLHFLPKEERLNTLVELRQRLKPGAPLVVVLLSFPQDAGQREIWLNRHAAFVASSDSRLGHPHADQPRIGEDLPILSPQEDEDLLKEAGFQNVSLFYTGFTLRGWVAHAPKALPKVS